jgi:hypothetical protein
MLQRPNKKSPLHGCYIRKGYRFLPAQPFEIMVLLGRIELPTSSLPIEKGDIFIFSQ